MDAWLGLWLFAVSLGAGALGGMLGMASGIFIVPILTVFGHLDIRTAIAASIVSVIACSCGSCFGHWGRPARVLEMVVIYDPNFYGNAERLRELAT